MKNCLILNRTKKGKPTLSPTHQNILYLFYLPSLFAVWSLKSCINSKLVFTENGTDRKSYELCILGSVDEK